MKKSRPQYQQSSPSHGNSSTALSLFTVEDFIGVLIPLALIALYWLVEVSK
ncbi:hypothetical protein [Geopseudomonas aromaticivorans]